MALFKGKLPWWAPGPKTDPPPWGVCARHGQAPYSKSPPPPGWSKEPWCAHTELWSPSPAANQQTESCDPQMVRVGGFSHLSSPSLFRNPFNI